jgi:hypothetical protein
MRDTKADRVGDLVSQIRELKNPLPAHSIPSTLLEQLDKLEEELERELKNTNGGEIDAKADGRGGL